MTLRVEWFILGDAITCSKLIAAERHGIVFPRGTTELAEVRAWECGNKVERMIKRSIPARMWYALCWYPCWAVAKLLFRFRWSGAENVPSDGPVLIASNHQSHLDPVLVGIACPRQLRFLARHTLFFWPLAWLIRSLGAVPIDRASGRGGIKATLKLLKEGAPVLVFPEGTRTPDGALQPLHAGFCALARRSGATIVPAALDGAYAAMPRGSRLPRPRPITLRFGRPIAANEYEALGDEQLVELIIARMRAELGIATEATEDTERRNWNAV